MYGDITLVCCLQKFVYTQKTPKPTDEEVASAALTDSKVDSDKSSRYKRQSDDDPAAVLGRGERPSKVEVLVRMTVTELSTTMMLC